MEKTNEQIKAQRVIRFGLSMPGFIYVFMIVTLASTPNTNNLNSVMTEFIVFCGISLLLFILTMMYCLKHKVKDTEVIKDIYGIALFQIPQIIVFVYMMFQLID